MNRQKLYRRLVITLNAITFGLLMIDLVCVLSRVSVRPLGLVWNWVGVAITIFIDTCQTDVLAKVRKKGIAILEIDAVIIYSLIFALISIAS